MDRLNPTASVDDTFTQNMCLWGMRRSRYLYTNLSVTGCRQLLGIVNFLVFPACPPYVWMDCGSQRRLSEHWRSERVCIAMAMSGRFWVRHRKVMSNHQLNSIYACFVSVIFIIYFQVIIFSGSKWCYQIIWESTSKATVTLEGHMLFSFMVICKNSNILAALSLTKKVVTQQKN
jgi:hypothetical protein